MAGILGGWESVQVLRAQDLKCGNEQERAAGWQGL